MSDNIVSLFKKPNEDVRKALEDIIIPDIMEKLENGSFESLTIVHTYTDEDNQSVSSNSIFTADEVNLTVTLGSLEALKFRVAMLDYVQSMGNEETFDE